VLAVDASGAMLMWTPSNGGSNPQYSTDGGNTWTAAGAPPGLRAVVADKVTPNLFYAFDGTSFYSTTTSGGIAFTKVNSTKFYAGTPANPPAANPARAGDLWLALSDYGLYHSTNGGVTWTAVTSFLQANMVSVGAANPHARDGVQSVFVFGTPNANSPYGVYRSDNNGAAWVRLNDAAHQYGGPSLIATDSRVYGRVYLGMNGRGIVYGDILDDPLGGGGAGPQ
jgi:hypothetical protein